MKIKTRKIPYYEISPYGVRIKYREVVYIEESKPRRIWKICKRNRGLFILITWYSICAIFTTPAGIVHFICGFLISLLLQLFIGALIIEFKK